MEDCRRRSSSADRLLRRRALARAIRGSLPRFPMTRRALYQHLRDGGVSHEAARLMAEAFGREDPGDGDS